MIWVGIDPGTHTGLAVWDAEEKRFLSIETTVIHRAMLRVEALHARYGDDLIVRFEDARQRTWFGAAGREQLQGAGSIKRDCSIWEDFLADRGISFMALPPKASRTKMRPDAFSRITGWAKRCSEHARDAAMMVFGLRP